MNVPRALRSVDAYGAVIRRNEYRDGYTIVVDFGTSREVSVDVVDDTAIVVAGDHQFEFDVPDGAGTISVNNGVLTIEE